MLKRFKTGYSLTVECNIKKSSNFLRSQTWIKPLLPSNSLIRKHTILKGAKTIWVRSAQSRWERRQAILQIVLHTDGIHRSKPLLIFKTTCDKTRKLVDKKIHAEWKSYN
jgi:hypothetical protein